MTAIPTIHLNGTSREDLTEALREAVHAIHKAGRKLAATCPNGRDYYPQGAAAITVALAEHEDRMRKLREVASELEHIAEYIQ